MLNGLLNGNLARAVADSVCEEQLAELRLRIGREPLAVSVSGKRLKIRSGGAPHIVSREELDGIIMRATNMSLYSVSEELLHGYIPSAGLRIGAAGEGVSDGGKLIGVKNLSYLVLRIPHQIRSAADKIYDRVVREKEGEAYVKSTLIIAPPCGGKTTLLRELARRASAVKSTVIIDERYEIACVTKGVPTLDVGDAEVVSGVNKCVAYENVLRAMSPEIIVTDELFRREEVEMIADAMRAGVKVFASVHGDGISSLKKSPIFAPLMNFFELVVELGASPIGSVRSVTEL